MVKVFTTNQSGKIELTPAELEELLKQAYSEGYDICEINHNTHFFTTPSSPTVKPYTYNIRTENDLFNNLKRESEGVYKK